MDDRAKFGFFDFFDLHRDQLDWGPNTMLQHDGKVLVAGGHGNLKESFAINYCAASLAWSGRCCCVWRDLLVQQCV